MADRGCAQGCGCVVVVLAVVIFVAASIAILGYILGIGMSAAGI